MKVAIQGTLGESVAGAEALLRAFLEVIHSEASIQAIEVDQGKSRRVLFQLRADLAELPRITGRDGRTWQLLRGLVRLAGAQHGLDFDLGLIEPPQATWLAGIEGPIHRLPVKITGCPLGQMCVCDGFASSHAAS